MSLQTKLERYFTMEELVKKAKIGDKDAFSTLILLLEKDLYKIAKMRLKDD